jgi:hypothetical protein
MINPPPIFKTRCLTRIGPYLWVAILFFTFSGCNFPALQANQQQPQAPEETIAYLYALQTYEALARTRQVAAVLEGTAPVPTQSPTDAASSELPMPETPTPTATSTLTPIPTPSYTQLVSSPTNTVNPPTQSPPTKTNTLPPPTATPGAPSPTNSPSPTITSTTPPSQNNTLCYNGNGQYEVPYNVNGPNLDGNIRYWTAPRYSVPYVVYGWEDYAGDYDVEGYFQLNWNNNYLFIAVNVQDERYKQFSDAASRLYEGDSIEILFDANLCDDINDGSMNQDDYQIGISPGYASVDGPKYTYQWYPSSKKLPSIVVGSDRNDQDDTIYEVAIPWSILGVSNPQPGSAFGFTLSISDNDHLEKEIQQTLKSSSSGRSFNPRTWGTIILK